MKLDDPPLFFSFGNGEEAFALFGGTLIFDSGEAEDSFLFRCQDRFYSYASLLGFRPILFVADAAHAGRYAEPLAAYRKASQTISERTGILPLLSAPSPLFVGLCPEILKLFPLTAQSQPEQQTGYCTPARVLLNQISPSASAFLAQLHGIASSLGLRLEFDTEACKYAGNEALKLHDKLNAQALLESCREDQDLRSLPAAVLEAEEFLGLSDWRALLSLYRQRSGDFSEPAELVVKSSRDSGGNVAAMFDAARFEAARQSLAAELTSWSGDVGLAEAIAEVRSDIAGSPMLLLSDFLESRLVSAELRRRDRRRGVRLLVQRRIRPQPGSRARPSAVGLSFFIGEGGVETICLSAQIYRDAARRHFRGALLDTYAEQWFRGSRFEAAMHGACRSFAAAGYRGPINFDALLDEDGEYRLIGDCNPRLSAVFPPLALRSALGRDGLNPETILSLGYRGEFRIPDLSITLGGLDEAGLLFSKDEPRGAMIVPSLVCRDAYDIQLIDVPAGQILKHLDQLPAFGVQASTPLSVYGLPLSPAEKSTH